MSRDPETEKMRGINVNEYENVRSTELYTNARSTSVTNKKVTTRETVRNKKNVNVKKAAKRDKGDEEGGRGHGLDI